MQGLYVKNSIGRYGNHLITIFNAIYLCKKYNYRYLLLGSVFKTIGVKYNLINIILETCETVDEETFIKVNKLQEIGNYMIFHLSNFMPDQYKRIDYNEYKTICTGYYKKLVNLTPLDESLFSKPETTLFAHLKITDNLLQNTHVKYAIYPLGLYLFMMQKFKLTKLVITTDDITSNYLIELSKMMKTNNMEIEIISKNVFTDFQIMTNAKWILLDLSTYTFMAHMVSDIKQNVIVIDSFFKIFMNKYKNYVDILLFDEDIIRQKYIQFIINDYPQCGEWYANADDMTKMYAWQPIDGINIKLVDVYEEEINRVLAGDNIILSSSIDDDYLFDNLDGFSPASEGNNTGERPMKKKYKIALIGGGLMSIPPNGWGAMEILIWDYHNSLVKYGCIVDIINIQDTRQIIALCNAGNYDFIHLHYDRFFNIIDSLSCRHIAITSHYPYIDNDDPKRHAADNYQDIMKYLTTDTKTHKLMLAAKDISAIKCKSASPENAATLRLLPNGIPTEKFRFSPACEMENYTICLGWITTRKRQAFLQSLKVEGLHFAGRKEDMAFNYKDAAYLGEWSRKQVYENLTRYSNLILLSNGEADPLVIKEAIISGCGIVATRISLAGLGLQSFPVWITEIPDACVDDGEYIRGAILDNRRIMKEGGEKLRQEIHDYGVENYNMDKSVGGDYLAFIDSLFTIKPRIMLVGTGTSDIPAVGWGAVEGIIWEYKTILAAKGYDVQIINEKGNINKMVRQILADIPDVLHIMYDDRIDILDIIFNTPTLNTQQRDKLHKLRIIYTTHWAYLPQIYKYETHPYYSNIFMKALKYKDKIDFFVISSDIANVYIKYGVSQQRIRVVKNGGSSKILYYPCPQYNDRCIYLGKIDYRKRQYLFQGFKNIDFAGNIADERFNANRPNYLGEWTREEVFSKLSNYASCVLLSNGEADPLVVKEAMLAGCGVVVSQFAIANLDIMKPWICIIPENKITDFTYIKEQIEDNMRISVAMREEIREYALRNFLWDDIVSYYTELLGYL